MKPHVSALIQNTAAELHLDVCSSPFFAADGIELRKQIEATDTLFCVGCICGPNITEIYRRIESKRDLFVRTKLWFLWNWLIKPRLQDNQYAVVRVVPSLDFNDRVFVETVKNELGDKPL